MNQEIFETLFEAKVLVNRWKIEYNTIRPLNSLNYRPPSPEAIKLEWLENVLPSLNNWNNLSGTTYKVRSMGEYA